MEDVDGGFDYHDIPYDVLWLDIEHTDGKKYFTWDKALFPNPKDMQNKIGAKGRKMVMAHPLLTGCSFLSCEFDVAQVTIVDPHVKRDNSYKVHTKAEAAGYYIQNADVPLFFFSLYEKFCLTASCFFREEFTMATVGLVRFPTWISCSLTFGFASSSLNSTLLVVTLALHPVNICIP